MIVFVFLQITQEMECDLFNIYELAVQSVSSQPDEIEINIDLDWDEDKRTTCVNSCFTLPIYRSQFATYKFSRFSRSKRDDTLQLMLPIMGKIYTRLHDHAGDYTRAIGRKRLMDSVLYIIL